MEHTAYERAAHRVDLQMRPKNPIIRAMTDEQLIETLIYEGSPTTGELAQELWRRASGSYDRTPQEAKAMYERAGYIPFSGFPLKAKGDQ